VGLSVKRMTQSEIGAGLFRASNVSELPILSPSGIATVGEENWVQ